MNTEARTEARNSIDNLLATLKESLAQPGHSLLPLLNVMSRFAKYSLSNQLLIFAQRPDATHVCGYRTWLKSGRQVRKGEKGIAIYAPMRFAKRHDADDPDSTDLSAAPRLGYRVAYVFDIAQVDALPGTEVVAAPAPVGTADAHRATAQRLSTELAATTVSQCHDPSTDCRRSARPGNR